MPSVCFVTVSDRAYFPGTAAMAGTVRRFHSNARIVVVSSSLFNEGLTRPQLDALARLGVETRAAQEYDAPGAVLGAWQLKAYAASRHLGECDVLVGIDSDCLLCGPINDVIESALRTGRIAGGVDGTGARYDESYSAYGFPVPSFNPKYMSTSLYVVPNTSRWRDVFARWANCCNEAMFGPQPLRRYPGHGDQGVLNALIHGMCGADAVHLLDNATWSQHWVYWQQVISHDGAGTLVNLTAAGRRQRAIHSTGDAEKLWTSEHSRRVREANRLQVVPYAWFLGNLFGNECIDLGTDPRQVFAGESAHLVRDVVDLFDLSCSMTPALRERWRRLGGGFLGRLLEGIRTFMPVETSIRVYVDLVRESVPSGGRVVEVGSYEGGSVVALALSCLDRDISIFSVESFTGNGDGTMDGQALPSAARYAVNTKQRYQSLRLVTIAADSIAAAASFGARSLDFVFIDACHTTEAVSRDIAQWLPRIRRGGIIAGDDYDWPSVRAAVDRHFGDRVRHKGVVWHVRIDSVGDSEGERANRAEAVAVETP